MFSLEDRFKILKTLFQSQCCVVETVSILTRNMGHDKVPTVGAIRNYDLTPLEFFQWGAVNDSYYADPETT